MNCFIWFVIVVGFIGLFILVVIFLNNNGIVSGNELVEDSLEELFNIQFEDSLNEFIIVLDNVEGEIVFEEIKLENFVIKEILKIEKNEIKKEYLVKVDLININNEGVVIKVLKDKIFKEYELRQE